MKKITTKQIAGIGILSAFSAILYLFVKFPLPFFPPWLEIQISEIPLIICGYIYGPVGALIGALIRLLVKLPLSHTGFVGEFADFIIVIPLILITSLMYRKKKTFKRALGSFIIGSMCSTVVAILSNKFILIPYYIKFANYTLEMLVEACSTIKIMSNITVSTFYKYYLFCGVLPFNLFRYLIVGITTFLLYKKIHKLLDKIK